MRKRAVLTTIQTNFASGEVDPLFLGQVLLKSYDNGALRLRNCMHRATGGMARRFGTHDVAALNGRSRMAEFEFSNTQRYVLAFSEQRLDIFDVNGGYLHSVVLCPWTEAMAFELTYSGRGDTMLICHDGMVPQILRRIGAVTFELVPFTFDRSTTDAQVYQPYFKFARADVTMMSSGLTGSVTLTSSADVFVAGHVGTRFLIYDCEFLITAVTDARHATATVKGEFYGVLDIDPLKTTRGQQQVEVLHLFHGLASGVTITLNGANTTGSIPGVQLDGAYVITVVDEHRYRYTNTAMSYDIRGDVNQDGTQETTHYTAAKDSEDGGGPNVRFVAGNVPTRAWKEQAFSPVRGYPGACAFHEGRLWFGGTGSQPDAEFSSSALNFFRFDVGKGLDGDSIQVQSGSEDLSRVLHLISNGDLLVFSATREAAFVTREGEPITPNNVRVKIQTDSGTGLIQPVVFDSAVLFIRENGLGISELAFSGNVGGYITTPISLLAGHLIRQPRSAAALSGGNSRAEKNAFFVNADGTVAVFHSMRNENIAGWGLWTLGAGTIESVCCIGQSTYFCVHVRGAYRLYKLADDDMACLDGQVVHTGAATKHWVLDARVRNRTVGIRTELGYHGDYAIGSSGVLDLEVPVTTVVAGDSFVFEIETLPPVMSVPAGPSVGFAQRIVRAVVQFENAYSLTIQGNRIETRLAGSDFAGPIVPINGQYEVHNLGFSRSPTIVVSQREPLPADILSISLEVKV